MTQYACGATFGFTGSHLTNRQVIDHWPVCERSDQAGDVTWGAVFREEPLRRFAFFRERKFRVSGYLTPRASDSSNQIVNFCWIGALSGPVSLDWVPLP